VCAFAVGHLSLRHTLYSQYVEYQIQQSKANEILKRTTEEEDSLHSGGRKTPNHSHHPIENLTLSQYVSRELEKGNAREVLGRVMTVPVFAFATARGKIYVVYNLQIPFIFHTQWDLSALKNRISSMVEKNHTSDTLLHSLTHNSSLSIGRSIDVFGLGVPSTMQERMTDTEMLECLVKSSIGGNVNKMEKLVGDLEKRKRELEEELERLQKKN
jgi:Fe2+ transport system protein B